MEAQLQQKIDDILQEINGNFSRNQRETGSGGLTQEQEQALVTNILFKVSAYFIELTDICLGQVTPEERESIRSKLSINKETIQALFDKRRQQAMPLPAPQQQLPTAFKRLPVELMQSIKQNKPKHPVSSFFFFFKEKSREIALSHNEKVGSRVAKLVADIWKGMNDQQKQPFERMANETRSKYDEEMRVFRQEYAEQITEIKKLKQQHKKMKKSTRHAFEAARSTSSRQISQIKQQHEGSSSDSSSEVDILSDSQASHSNDHSVPTSTPECAARQALANLSQQMEKKPKGPISSFFIYYRENCKRLAAEHNSSLGPNMIRIASEVWRALPPEEKLPYSVKAETTRKKYYEEMRRYKVENADELRMYRKMKQQVKRSTQSKIEMP